MPFNRGVPEEIAEELDALADQLRRPRDVVVDVIDRHGGQPASGSQAEDDAASREFEYARLAAIETAPRSVSSLLIRVATDHIAGLGSLFRDREITSAPPAIARAALEHSVRAVVILDHTADLRTKLARTLLHDLASANYVKTAISHVGLKNDPVGKEAAGTFAGAKERLLAVFPDAVLDGDAHKWEAGGERFLRITDATGKWCDLRDDDLPGIGVYDTLSLGSHPQTFLGNSELGVDEHGAPVLSTNLNLLVRYANAAVAPWVDGMRLILGYNGWETDELDAFLVEWSSRSDLGA